MALGPTLDKLSEWGLEYAQNPLEEGDLDVVVLVWNIHKRVDPAAFPDGRTTVRFEFTDAAEGKKLWWLVNAGGTVDFGKNRLQAFNREFDQTQIAIAIKVARDSMP